MAVGERIITVVTAFYADLVVLDSPEYGGRGALQKITEHPVKEEAAQHGRKLIEEGTIPGRTSFLP